jgi:Protein of unknown function (DUF3102)
MSDLPMTEPQGQANDLAVMANNDLAVLANRINSEHAEVVKAVIHGANHAIRAGQLLLQAKIAVRHGDWSEWLATNCRVSERSAQLYMQLAREFPQGLAAGVSLTAAIKMLEQMKSPEPKDTTSMPVGVRQKRNPVAEAIKKGPLAILERAWDATQSTVEPGRPHFRTIGGRNVSNREVSRRRTSNLCLGGGSTLVRGDQGCLWRNC